MNEHCDNKGKIPKRIYVHVGNTLFQLGWGESKCTEDYQHFKRKVEILRLMCKHMKADGYCEVKQKNVNF